jgi:hypothetical protein
MGDRPQAGDLYIVVDEMPSGRTWGHPFTVNPDTWLVKVPPCNPNIGDCWDCPHDPCCFCQLEATDE